METIANQTFEDCEVVLDGKSFDTCKFKGCALIYRGGTVPELSNCEFFPRTGLKLEGAADNTTVFLSNVYNHLPFGKAFTENLFDKIRIGV